MTVIETEAEPARITPAEIRDSYAELGRTLADWRKAARLTQRELALFLLCSRSGIANAETGRLTTTRDFWLRADRQLDADGLLIKAAEHHAELKRAYAAQTARDRRGKQTSTSRDADRPGCICAQVVARWTGRETRALREALRMGLPAFSRLLNVAAATVAAWERPPSPPTPSFAAQSALDRALYRSEPEVCARFWLLLDTPPAPAASRDAHNEQCIGQPAPPPGTAAERRRPVRPPEVPHAPQERMVVGRRAM